MDKNTPQGLTRQAIGFMTAYVRSGLSHRGHTDMTIKRKWANKCPPNNALLHKSLPQGNGDAATLCRALAASGKHGLSGLDLVLAVQHTAKHKAASVAVATALAINGNIDGSFVPTKTVKQYVAGFTPCKVGNKTVAGSDQATTVLSLYAGYLASYMVKSWFTAKYGFGADQSVNQDDTPIQDVLTRRYRLTVLPTGKTVQSAVGIARVKS